MPEESWMSLTQYQDQWYFFQFSDGASLASIPRRWQVFRNCLHTEKTSLENATKWKSESNCDPNLFILNLKFWYFSENWYYCDSIFPFIFHILMRFCTQNNCLSKQMTFFHVGKKTIRSRSNYDLWGCKFLQIYQEMETYRKEKNEIGPKTRPNRV
jgi:hypothetical protein